jgi:hypothetical protein
MKGCKRGRLVEDVFYPCRTPKMKCGTWATRSLKRLSKNTPSFCVKKANKRCLMLCGSSLALLSLQSWCTLRQEMEARGELLASDDTPQFLVKWKRTWRKHAVCRLTAVVADLFLARTESSYTEATWEPANELEDEVIADFYRCVSLFCSWQVKFIM